MAVLVKAIYKFNAVPIKILKSLLKEIEKPILTFIWPQGAKAILSKKNNLKL
jgi:hypothetical protein